MTARAVLWGRECFDAFGVRHKIFWCRFPIHMGDLVDRPKMGFRVSMAIKTPAHADGLRDLHHIHFIDAPVTAHTTDAGVQVNTVIEISVVGQLVHLRPLDGLACFP